MKATKHEEPLKVYLEIFLEAHEGIFQANLEGQIILANPAFARILGYDSPERALESIGNLGALCSDPLRSNEMMAHIINSGALNGLELSLLRKDMSPVELVLNARVVKDREGNSTCIQGMIMDITGKKRAGQLRPGESTQASDRAMKSFLSGISHKIRTPINAILGFSSLLLEAEITPSAKEMLEIINRSGENLLLIVNNIMELAQAEYGFLEINPSVFDPVSLIDYTAASFAESARLKGLAFNTDFGRDMPRHIVADEMKIRQVLSNVLSNAVKFTSKGGIKIKARPERSQGALAIVIEVEDTGEGIAPEEMQRLFGAFGHTSSGLRSRQGLGLSLAISRQYLKMMGGEIAAKSEPGKGSCFCFRFPAEEVRDQDNGGTCEGISPDELLSAISTAVIPRDLIDKIRSAAMEANIELLSDLTQELERYDVAAAKWIREMLLRFDYAAIINFLS